MKINRMNKNCYNCREFAHIARNCRNRGTEGRIGKRRRLKYRENGNNIQKRMIKGGNGQNSNLNRDGDLIILD